MWCKGQTRSNNNPGNEGGARGGTGRQGRQQRCGTANCLEGEVSDDVAFAFAVTEETNEIGATTEEPVVSVSINGIHKDALVDSGSVST